VRNVVDVELPFYRYTILYIKYSPFLDTTMSSERPQQFVGFVDDRNRDQWIWQSLLSLLGSIPV
jgi:hypothetical protein